MTAAPEFAIGDHDFLLDGEPFRVISGALHYFRVHPGHWADRIRKARQMGLNTVETYVAWNAHAPREGAFSLSGGLDLGRFLDLIAAEGMYAIVRPGPYICAELDNGGLPAWLFRSGATGVRRSEPRYLAAVGDYFRHLAPVLVPRQAGRGGPIILVQVENEYGAYGSDQGYLQALAELTRQTGITVPLITVDQPEDTMLRSGSVPGVLKTGSFGARVTQRLDTLRRHQPTGPLMCTEFWAGWFDHWGAHHHITPAAQAATCLDELLNQGASVNDNVTGLGAASALSGTLLSLHIYGTWASYAQESQWESDIAGRIGSYTGRTIIDEFGAPMTTGINYLENHNGAVEQSYFAAVTDLARADSMGSVYWAGLKTGDSYSMEAHRGSTLVSNNASGVTQVRWGWGY